MVNPAIAIHCIEAMTTNTFKKKFSLLVLGARYFIGQVTKLDVSTVNSIYKFMKKIADSLTKASEKNLLSKSLDPNLTDIGTEQVRHTI